MKRAFVIIPFGNEFDLIYQYYFMPPLNEMGYQTFRANDMFNTTMVMMDIYDAIKKSSLILCDVSDKVISVDVDADLIKNAKSKFSNIDNLTLKSGDGFKIKDSFTIFVSNLPYSKSKEAIEWLAESSFSHGVIMVQKEFAEKILAKSSKKRKAVSVIADYSFEIKILSNVGKNNFSPPPKVDSVILKIVKKNVMSKDLIQTINKIFSYRRKTVKNILTIQ